MTNLRDMIKKHEGLRLKPYLDTKGKLTIGYGRNLSSNGISQLEADFLFEKDLAIAKQDLASVIDVNKLSENRYNALVDMMFCLGRTRFKKFKNMVKALKEEDYDKAAYEMKNSLWYIQEEPPPNRVEDLSKILKEG